LIWMGVPTWKNYFHLLTNWIHSRMLVDKGKAYLLAGVFFRTRETQICT
jgi:hypothetical protein